MFEKSISAPTGCGLHKFVEEEALKVCDAEHILVISQFDYMGGPLKNCIKPHTYYHMGDAPLSQYKLIIVYEMADLTSDMIARQLSELAQPVWILNRPLPAPQN